ncbi:MAG: ion transporter [Gammaproteobacteria bacterium]|nr:ion transporter [Gammaproteobacteria bacterium]
MKNLRKRTAELLEPHYGAGGWGHVVDIFLVALILTNVLLIILETVPSISAQHKTAFTYFEIFSVVVFTIEYVLRLWSCVEDEADVTTGKKWTRIRWLFSPLGLIDLLAILPFYIFLFIPDSDISLLMLRLFRGLRLLRIFKLTRYSSALNILFSVLKREVRVLAVTSFILAMVLVMASWGIYLLERLVQPDVFGSIPAAMWWAVVTLTTVGYGDVVPVTDGGKMFAGLISLIGIGMMALPAGILAAGFTSEVHRRSRTYSRAVEIAYSDGQLTTQEAQELEILREELGLSKEETINTHLDAKRKWSNLTECPHCGEEL